MNITTELLDELTARAKQSPRRRVALDMRNTPDDSSQRMLNAIEPDSVIPIHRHPTTNESLFVIRGRAREIIYDDNGNELDSIEMAPCTDCIGINVAKGQFHTIVSLESGTVIFEAKDGPYTPLSPDDIF